MRLWFVMLAMTHLLFVLNFPVLVIAYFNNRKEGKYGYR